MVKQLIWDFRTGDVIDAESGVVVDRIYLPPQQHSDGEDLRRNLKLGAAVRFSRETKLFLRLLRKKSRQRKLRGCVVDGEALERFAATGRQVKVLVRPLPRELPESVKRIIEEVLPKYPRLGSRTLRGKVAIAYVLERLARGLPVDAAKIAEDCGTAKATVYRLAKELKQVPYLSALLDEVRKVLGVEKVVYYQVCYGDGSAGSCSIFESLEEAEARFNEVVAEMKERGLHEVVLERVEVLKKVTE